MWEESVGGCMRVCDGVGVGMEVGVGGECGRKVQEGV